MSVSGLLNAEFELTSAGTRLARNVHRYPLKVQKSFPVGGGQAAIVIMDASPGLLEGDVYDISLVAGRGTKVYATTQSYTKIHPSTQGKPAKQQIKLTVREDALLEFFPEPAMPYADSLYEGAVDISLVGNAVLLFGEILCPGRDLRGERFHYRSYQNTLQVNRDGKRLLFNRVRLQPQEPHFFSPAVLDGSLYMGTFYAFGLTDPRATVEALRMLCSEAPDWGSKLTAGISRTEGGGVVVTMSSACLRSMKSCMQSLREAVRRDALTMQPLYFLASL